jgi:integrase/recombinase XerD
VVSIGCGIIRPTQLVKFSQLDFLIPLAIATPTPNNPVNGCGTLLKVNRHGKAKILSHAEIQTLFNDGLNNLRDRVIFAVCLFTAVQINEAVTLHSQDVYDKRGNVRDELTFRKSNTKGKLATRTIPVIDELRIYLEKYKPEAGRKWLFPGGVFREEQTHHINPRSASRVLKKAFDRVEIDGASTHSMRRTALTLMSNAGIPLRTIQEVSGHRNLEQLQQYLEVQPEQVRGAVSILSMLSPVDDSPVNIQHFKPRTAYNPYVQEWLKRINDYDLSEPISAPRPQIIEDYISLNATLYTLLDRSVYSQYSALTVIQGGVARTITIGILTVG